MRILVETDKQLILKHISLHHILGRSMLVGGLIVFGLFLALITTSANLSCRRTADNKINCLIERFTSVRKLEDVEVSGLSGATFKEYPQGYPRYETIISTEQGEISLLGHAAGDYRSNHLIALRIREFVISADQKSFFVQTDGNNFFLVERVGLAFLIGIGLLFSVNPIVNCVFDTNLNQFTLTRKRFFLQSKMSYSLDLVVDIKLENSAERKYTLGLVDKLYRIIIVFEGSEHMPLFRDYSLSETDARYFARKISMYLNR